MTAEDWPQIAATEKSMGRGRRIHLAKAKEAIIVASRCTPLPLNVFMQPTRTVCSHVSAAI
ncbi:hypothetical protein GHK45_10070 [Sinorhizobium meliloti]|uniref:Uncharacterized protein n=1 Tax=Rhizobium meliloti TaxID=382 RepID=A0A6A7ZMG1_RHIML|nr:hypothetical protein [Sinorhizobium meliloti]MQW04133.1 hypothetical protein [Sinorhizobium meliloti]